MKKAGKKLLSLLLAAMLVVSVLSPSFCALAAETKAIKSVETFENLQVAYGTPFAELGLPEQVAVTLDNEEEIVCDVIWDSSQYSSTYFGSWQHLSGTLVLPEGVNNPNNITAQYSVQVLEPQPVWEEEFEPIEVDYGFDFLSYLGEIHPTKKVRLENGTEYTLDITWTGEGDGFGYEPGQHLVVGHVTGGPWQSISCSLNAQISVTIREPAEILSVKPVEALEIWIGTNSETFARILHEKYPEVTVELNDDTTDTLPVIWDVGASGYSGEVEEAYTISGQIQIPSGSKIVNPDNYAAEVEIRVVPAKPLQTQSVSTWEALRDAVANPLVSTITLSSDITMEDSLTLERSVVLKSDSRDNLRTLKSAPQKRHFQIKRKIIPEDTSEVAHIEFSGVVLDGNGVSGGIEQIGDKIEIKGAKIANFAPYDENAESEDQTGSKVEYAASIYQADLAELHISNCQGNGLLLSETSTINGATITGTGVNNEFGTSKVGMRIAGRNSDIRECTVSGFYDGCSSTGTPFTATASAFFGNHSGAYLYAGSEYGLGYTVTFSDCDFYENAESGITMRQNGWPSLFIVALQACNVHENLRGIRNVGGRLRTSNNTEIHDNVYGIDTLEGQLSLVNSKVYQNSGIGVYSYLARITSINGCEIYQNGSEENGGGGVAVRTYYDSNGSNTEIKNTRVYGNISNSKVEYGYTYTAGISVDSSIGITLIQNCEIYNNHGDDTPGGIFLASDHENSTSITGCTIRNNSSSRFKGGGACIMTRKQSMDIANCKFISNTARRAGGVYVRNFTPSWVFFKDSCEFSNNTAEYTGGAIEGGAYQRINIDASTIFEGNSSTNLNAEVPPEDADTTYPNIKYASTSIYDHPINNWDISYCPGTKDEYVTEVVTKVYPKTVKYGTPISSLALPSQSTINLDSSGRVTVAVDWSNSGYDPHLPGKQTIKGTLVLGEYMMNLDNYAVEAEVTVYDPNTIISCTGIDETIGVYKAQMADIGEIITRSGQLPEEGVATMGDGKTYHVPIEWDREDIHTAPSSEGDYIEYYWIEGTIDYSCIPNLKGSPDPKAKFTLYDKWNSWGEWISEVSPVPAIVVESGTNASQLFDTLSARYPTMCAALSLEGGLAYKMLPVTWDVTGSTFNGNEPGTYTIYGDLNLEGGDLPLGVQISDGVRAEIEVIIEKKTPIVSLDKRGITVEQNTYLQPLAREYLLKGTPTTVTPPDTVMARLEGGSTEELPVVWHLEEFNPAKVTAENEDCQEIKGDLVIPEGSNIENPDGLIPKLEITVTPMTYKVAQASPKEISVEVYKGTTLAELNRQLEDEGLNEISIMATKPNNAVKRTFCKIFLEEGVNPDWNTQKDECGTYTLTASWPENIQPRSAKVPGPIHVNVTVKEPLEIKETKLAQANLYQGVDILSSENAGRVPSRVTAVLEDDSEVEIDVEWDWSFFNKDSLTNPPIIGRLVNLPRKAKQPEGEEITGNMTIQMIPVQYTILKFSSISLTAKAGLTLEEITTLAGEEGSGIPAFERAFRFSGIAEDGKTFNVVRNIPFVLTSEDNPEFSSTAVQEYVLIIAMALPENISTEGASGYDRITLTTEPVGIAALESVSTIDREGTPFAELANVPDQVLATLDVAGPDGVAKTARLTVNWGEGEGYTPFPEGLTDDDTSVTMVIEGSLENIPAYILPTNLAPTLSVTLGREFDIQSISLAQSDEVEVKLGTDFAAVDGLVNHEATLTLRCTNGETRIQTVSFELQESGYDPMTVGVYHLAGRLLVGSNVKNPENVSVEVVVRTMKYRIVESYAPDGDIIMSVGEDPLDYLPGTVPALLSNDELEEVPVNWDLNTIDTEVSDFYVVEGQYVLPIYLENPDDCQPVAFVFVDEPESQIISMTQLLDNEEGRVRRVARREREIPGYAKHRYRVERLYEDGSVKEQIVTLYSKVS